MSVSRSLFFLRLEINRIGTDVDEYTQTRLILIDVVKNQSEWIFELTNQER